MLMECRWRTEVRSMLSSLLGPLGPVEGKKMEKEKDAGTEIAEETTFK